MKRGKRGGYRIIYYLQTAKEQVVLLTIYAKSRKEDIRVQEIISLLEWLEIEL